MHIYLHLIVKQIAKQVNPSTEKKVLDFVRKGGILRPQDLQKKGVICLLSALRFMISPDEGIGGQS